MDPNEKPRSPERGGTPRPPHDREIGHGGGYVQSEVSGRTDETGPVTRGSVEGGPQDAREQDPER